MIDRLPALKALLNSPVDQIPQQAQSDSSSQFMQFVRQAQSAIERVSKTNANMRKLKEQFIVTTSSQQEARLHHRLKDLMNANTADLNFVRDSVQKLKPLIEEAQNKPRNEITVQDRMKITMHATLIKQFQDALGEAEKAQDSYNEAAHKKTETQLRMVEPDISEEMVDRCMADPQQAQQLIEQRMVGAHSDVIRMAKDIEDRLEDIKALEENINILHRLFLDLAALVHAQGQILNSVEKHVDTAVNYVERGNKKLEEAKEHQKSARWKKCCLLIIVLVILLVIVIPTISLTAV